MESEMFYVSKSIPQRKKKERGSYQFGIRMQYDRRGFKVFDSHGGILIDASNIYNGEIMINTDEHEDSGFYFERDDSVENVYHLRKRDMFEE